MTCIRSTIVTFCGENVGTTFSLTFARNLVHSPVFIFYHPCKLWINRNLFLICLLLISLSSPFTSISSYSSSFALNHLCLLQRDDEINSLNKKIQQVENDLDTTTENLSTANTNLESANKQVQEVSIWRERGKLSHIWGKKREIRLDPGLQKGNSVISGERKGKFSHIRGEKRDIQWHPERESKNLITSGERKGTFSHIRE